MAAQLVACALEFALLLNGLSVAGGDGVQCLLRLVVSMFAYVLQFC